MKLLAIDTSTDACSVAIKVDGQTLSDHRVVSQQHGALVLPMVDSLMSDAGLKAAQLDALIYGCGPGSFTGVRIGVATAQGIALGAGIGVIGVSTLQSIAQGCYREHGDSLVAISVDARMDEVYFCEFRAGRDGLMQAVCEEQIVSPANVVLSAAEIWAGSGAERYQDILHEQFSVVSARIRRACLPQAVDLLAIGANKVKQGQIQSADNASPVYLRNKVALTTAERAQQHR
ncbi:MAG: tRNA (adenosine(37)-N6)-threonylcarbamoyltransferase complex dimerization subunit type 1 TsaB [Granulosicoccus sp.]